MAVADGQPPQESSLSPHASNDAAAAAAAREREAAVTLQRFARRFVARKRFSRLRAVALRLQRWRRQRVARRALGRHGGADSGGSKAAFAQGGGRSRKALAVTVARNVLVAAVWFACSAALSIFNRGLVGSHRGAFPAPLLMTALQFLYQYLLAAGVLRLTACAGQRPHRELGWEEFLSGVAPTGVCTGMDIGASNLALVYITVSFYTMCKSSSPAFLLLFAFLARVEKPNWALAGIIATICLGVVLTVAGETQFHLGAMRCCARAPPRCVRAAQAMRSRRGMARARCARADLVHAPAKSPSRRLRAGHECERDERRAMGAHAEDGGEAGPGYHDASGFAGDAHASDGGHGPRCEHRDRATLVGFRGQLVHFEHEQLRGDTAARWCGSRARFHHDLGRVQAGMRHVGGDRHRRGRVQRGACGRAAQRAQARWHGLAESPSAS